MHQSTLPLKPPLIRWLVLTLDVSGSLLCPGSLNLTGRTSGQRCGYQTKTPSISSGMFFRSLEFMGPNIFVLSLVTLDLRLKQYQLVSLTLAQNSLSVDRKRCSRWQSFKNDVHDNCDNNKTCSCLLNGYCVPGMAPYIIPFNSSIYIISFKFTL